jgi:hypothetical protein
MQLPHSLKAPGFNPWTYKVMKTTKTLVCLQIRQLVPLQPGGGDAGADRGQGPGGGGDAHPPHGGGCTT